MAGMEENVEPKKKPSLWVSILWAALLILVAGYAENSHSFLAKSLRFILSPYHDWK
jgi:hypothetical protein